MSGRSSSFFPARKYFSKTLHPFEAWSMYVLLALWPVMLVSQWDELISPVATWLHLLWSVPFPNGLSAGTLFGGACLPSERSDWDRPHCSILLTATPLHIAWITPNPNWALSLEFSSLLLMSSTPSSLQPSFVIGCFLLVGIPHCLLTRKFAQILFPAPPWVLPDMDLIDLHSV